MTDPSALCNNWAHDNLTQEQLDDDAIYDLVTDAWDAGWDACYVRLKEILDRG